MALSYGRGIKRQACRGAVPAKIRLRSPPGGAANPAAGFPRKKRRSPYVIPRFCRPLGYVHSVETFGLVDGPGVRYVLFLQGLPHALPLLPQPRDLGLFRENAQTPREAFDAAYRYHNYWKNNGGLTVSGGEPLLQIEF